MEGQFQGLSIPLCKVIMQLTLTWRSSNSSLTRAHVRRIWSCRPQVTKCEFSSLSSLSEISASEKRIYCIRSFRDILGIGNGDVADSLILKPGCLKLLLPEIRIWYD
jgi:hypothetical protein